MSISEGEAGQYRVRASEYNKDKFDIIEKELNIQGTSVSGDDIMSDHPDVKALIQKEVDAAMTGFSNYERIKEFSILPRLFTLEDGELTPTLKVIRKVVLENYSEVIERIYNNAN